MTFPLAINGWLKAVRGLGIGVLLVALTGVSSCRRIVEEEKAPAGEVVVQESDSGREAIVCVLSWFSPMGALNGSRQWKLDGYNYAGDKKSGSVRNYPLPVGEPLPVTPPPFGSNEFYEMVAQQARASQRLMQEGGFDVMTFDMLPLPDYDPSLPLDERNAPLTHFKTFIEWVRAGEETGMKVALMPDIANQSGDFPERRHLSADEWVKVLEGALDLVPDSPALWRIDGKPVVIHFGSDTTYSAKAAPVSGSPPPDGGWRQVLERLRNKGKEFFFIADARPSDRIQEWGNFADGLHIFAPGAPGGFLPEYQKQVAENLTIPIIWTISPGYYRKNTAWVEPDFERIHELYLAALESDARWIYVLTWNDFEEETDIAPSVNKGRALLDVFWYYNTWFKTGHQPELKEEKVILAMPKRIPETVMTRSPIFGAGKWTAPPYKPKIFYWAWVKEPTTLEIEGIGKTDLPPGLSFGTLGAVDRVSGAPLSLTASLDRRMIKLPEIVFIKEDSHRAGEGGMEYQYIDLSGTGGQER